MALQTITSSFPTVRQSSHSTSSTATSSNSSTAFSSPITTAPRRQVPTITTITISVVVIEAQITSTPATIIITYPQVINMPTTSHSPATLTRSAQKTTITLQTKVLSLKDRRFQRRLTTTSSSRHHRTTTTKARCLAKVQLRLNNNSCRKWTS